MFILSKFLCHHWVKNWLCHLPELSLATISLLGFFTQLNRPLVTERSCRRAAVCAVWVGWYSVATIVALQRPMCRSASAPKSSYQWEPSSGCHYNLCSCRMSGTGTALFGAVEHPARQRTISWTVWWQTGDCVRCLSCGGSCRRSRQQINCLPRVFKLKWTLALQLYLITACQREPQRRPCQRNAIKIAQREANKYI